MNPRAQLALPVRLRDHASFASFEAGDDAGLVAQLASQAVTPRGAQPCWLWGGPGSGRSHLLQAICAAAGASGHAATYLPLAELEQLGPGVLEGHERSAVVCLDDLDQVVAHRAWAVAVFGLYNTVREVGGWLVFVTGSAPSALVTALPDLDSRLAAAAVHRVHALGEEGLLRALEARAHRLGLQLPEDTARWLIHRMPRDATSLFAVLDLLDQAALEAQRRLSVPFVREVLASVPRDGSPPSGARLQT
ncbi:MAG: DnaA regulatory inactivator Hda [Gammaproteobacteria bacterium]|nr:DnaA regulatory inactivator Hda [Gammaproteobacteria bacterium]